MSHWDEAVEAAGNKLAELQRCDCVANMGKPWHGGPGLTKCCLVHRVEVSFLLEAALPSLRAMWAEEEVEGKWLVKDKYGTWVMFNGSGESIAVPDEPTARRYANALNRADRALEGK